KKKIICQSAPSTDPVAIARQGGFETKLEEIAPEIEILEVQVIDTWQKDESIEKMEAALQKYPQIDGGYGHTDTIAVGLATAADDAGRVGDMVVVGIDGTIDGFTAIEAGIMYGTVLQSPLVTADEVLNVVFKILKGEEVPKLINVPFYKIKLEDLENYVIEDPPRLKE
ncbi:MAG: substrate-binding domain-containing protein, partial [Actinobacteria bacterium]|nr:substrate-binding domain-containing protein [Actinomycetota bacterium]